jgi:hypothetical protein
MASLGTILRSYFLLSMILYIQVLYIRLAIFSSIHIYKINMTIYYAFVYGRNKYFLAFISTYFIFQSKIELHIYLISRSAANIAKIILIL